MSINSKRGEINWEKYNAISGYT